jgi:hypothetical protein
LARLCSVIATSHSPFLFIDGERWGRVRELRNLPGRYAPDAPTDPAEVNRAKHARCMSAFAELRRQLTAAAPDVLVIFGDDQDEQFKLANMPSLAVYAGEEFAGFRISRFEGVPLPGTKRPERRKTDEHWATVPGCPALAKHLITGLVQAGFDPAWMLSLPDPGEGMSHAFMRPLHVLRTDCDLPTVPVFVNCFYGPQPTAARCYQLGRAVRELIGSWPEDLRVAVIGSGGLWHTPLDVEATIDEPFNDGILAAVESGDARAMAATFDAGLSRPQPASAAGGSGMTLGYGSGTGETRNWIAAAAVADGVPGKVIDSVSIWASPIGVAFACWPMEGADA